MKKKVVAGAILAVGVFWLATHCRIIDRSQFIPSADKYDVRILRDEWGVPHIFGKTDADVGYGLGYAHSEDDWLNIEKQILTGRAQLASVYGINYAKYDYLVHLFRIRDFVDQKYETDLSPEVRALVEGYADGITHFAALHPEKMRDIDLPVTGKDIVAAITFMTPFFYQLQDTLNNVLPKSAYGVLNILAANDDELVPGTEDPDWSPQPVIGSNAWAVGPARSADGATRLAINSHMPWDGDIPYYEAHLHSEQGWNMTGCTFPGGPLVFMGHDENKGWAHTISKPNLSTAYSLTLNPDNRNQYKLDDEWREFDRKRVKINIRLWGPLSWTIRPVVLASVHGPVVRYGDRAATALSFAGYGEVRQLEQWYRMNKACNLDEFKDAMGLLGLLSLNTVYADKDGNIFYAYAGRFAERTSDWIWGNSAPGGESKYLWGDVYPFDELPQVLNPPCGFVQNCNSSPFYTTLGCGNPDPEDFPTSMGVEANQNNRSRRATELYATGAPITREQFHAYKYDSTNTTDSWVIKWLNDLYKQPVPDDPLMQDAIRLLKGWNRKCTKDNRAAALALMSGWHHSKQKTWIKSVGQMDIVREAAQILTTQFGRIDPPLEDVLRLRHGNVDIGLGGGPDCLRAIYFEVSDDGRMVGNSGDTHMQFVEWDKDGRMQAEAVHQYGNATGDPRSPHYSDQAQLFADEKTRPVWLTEEEIKQHLQREYRPGDFKGPWYRD